MTIIIRLIVHACSAYIFDSMSRESVAWYSHQTVSDISEFLKGVLSLSVDLRVEAVEVRSLKVVFMS